MAEDLLRRKVQIPSVGDVLILDQAWTFRLFHEYRNDTLLALHGKTDRSKGGHTVVTIPKGTELRVDRIYIRKGVKDYDSLTFLAKGLRKEKVALPDCPPEPKMVHDLGDQPSYGMSYNGPAYEKACKWQDDYQKLWQAHQKTPAFKAWRKAYEAREDAKALRRPVRFWAKLVDVNQMVVRSAGWEEREEPLITRQIDLEE